LQTIYNRPFKHNKGKKARFLSQNKGRNRSQLSQNKGIMDIHLPLKLRVASVLDPLHIVSGFIGIMN